MHREVLTQEQVSLLPLVRSFSRSFGLVGCTAAALQIGHRRSIDFDLFSHKPFRTLDIRKKIRAKKRIISRVFADRLGEYTMVIAGVKLTFFHYPFAVSFPKRLDGIRVADILTLAAMKAYALGRRAKWKDYVDLYFVMKQYHGIGAVVQRAKRMFGSEFNEKLFRAQLAYFKDIDRSEEVIFMEGHAVSDAEVQKQLQRWSLG